MLFLCPCSVLLHRFPCMQSYSLISGPGKSPGEGIGYWLQYSWTFVVSQVVNNLPATWETWVRSLGWEDLLEEGTATHTSILAWKIPMDRGTCQGPWGRKELDMTEQLRTAHITLYWNYPIMCSSPQDCVSQWHGLDLIRLCFQQETHFQSLGWEDPLVNNGMCHLVRTHSKLYPTKTK